MIRTILMIVALLLLPLMAVAQERAIVLEQTDGTALVVVFAADGTSTVFGDVTVVRQDVPNPVGNPYPVPNVILKRQVQPIVDYDLSRTDATALANVYGDAAKTVPGITTDVMRQAIIDAGKRLGLRDKYEGLDDVLISVKEDLLGTDTSRATTAADKTALNAIAWAFWEAGK